MKPKFSKRFAVVGTPDTQNRKIRKVIDTYDTAVVRAHVDHYRPFTVFGEYKTRQEAFEAV